LKKKIETSIVVLSSTRL